MAITLRLLKLLAKVGLDLVMGPTRSDEAVRLFEDWWSRNDRASRGQELAEAKEAASDGRRMAEVVSEAVADKGQTIAEQASEDLAKALSLVITDLPDQLGDDLSAAEFLERVVEPRWKKELEDLPPASSPPRPGTKAAQLFDNLSQTPTSYGQLWKRAKFVKDPFLRTTLRRLWKGGFVDRTVVEDNKELWFRHRDAWAEVDAIYDRLAASGRIFSDSAELLREDRDR